MNASRDFPIAPVILAAGPRHELEFPKALAQFGKKNAAEIALANCRAASPRLSAPILVLGESAALVQSRLSRHTLRGVHCITNRRWPEGQLTSILAALRHIPSGSAFMLYPVDLPLLTPEIIRELAAAYRRAEPPCVVMPRFKKRFGHPVIFSPDLRGELKSARTARDVAYRRSSRVMSVPVNTPAIYTDFSTPLEYRRCLRSLLRRPL